MAFWPSGPPEPASRDPSDISAAEPFSKEEDIASALLNRLNQGAMLAKGVIPCLDVHDGHVTRGVQFGKAEAGELRNVGDPVELAVRYNEQGADELVFFDITASAHGRDTMIEVIRRVADRCFMPLTV